MPPKFLQPMFAFILSFGLGLTFFYGVNQGQQPSTETGVRMPQAATEDIYAKLVQIEKDIDNEGVFNRSTAITYIKSLTEAAYNLETKDLYPETAQEKARFAEIRKDWMERLFRIQLKLREKMMSYNKEAPLTQEQVAAFRNANMYINYAQDFVLMEWSLSQDVSPKEQWFQADFPATEKNPAEKNFNLMPGDVILVRGGSFVSATIARSGDYLTNYSHVAMVVEDPHGNLSVAEALMEEGLITYPLEKYLSLERLSRAIIMRPKNPADGKAAALEGWKVVDHDLKAPVRKVFDMLMNPGNHDKIYCLELIKIAYAKGTHDRINLPTFPMTFKKALASNSFYRGMGNKLEIGAAPDDVFYEPDFNVVMSHRDVTQIKKDWAFDVAMSSVFEFIADRYDYKKDLAAAAQAQVAYFLKNTLKLQMKKVPPGVSADFIELIVEHKDITTTLQAYLSQLMEKNPRLLAYKELEAKAKEWLETNKDKYFVPCGARGKGKACGGFF